MRADLLADPLHVRGGRGINCAVRCDRYVKRFANSLTPKICMAHEA